MEEFKPQEDRQEKFPFSGFEPLSANFVFCPNQLFDLVVPNCSRPVVRLVSYVLHETLRWLDKNGNPIQQDIAISFNDLVEKAGIGRGSIRKAIAEAVQAGLIVCKASGKANAQSQAGRVGEYALKWDKTGNYAKSIGAFRGFYVGQGNRSPIPHSFFTHVVPREPLTVTKVVATVLRHTVGYQNHYGGGRRNHAELSFKRIQRYSLIASSASTAEAINHAIESKYIKRVSSGLFSKNPAIKSSATVYGINWLIEDRNGGNGSKNEAKERFNNRSGLSVQKTKPNQYKKQSGKGSEIESDEGFKKRSHIKNIQKTIQTNDAAANSESIKLLKQIGYDDRAAAMIADAATFSQIQNQIDWLKYRKATRNRLGFLRKAIVEDWPEPDEVAYKKRESVLSRRYKSLDHADYHASELLDRKRRYWRQRWFATPASERLEFKEQALRRESNPTVRRHLKKKSIDENPPPNFIIAMRQSKKRGVVHD